MRWALEFERSCTSNEPENKSQPSRPLRHRLEVVDPTTRRKAGTHGFESFDGLGIESLSL